MAEAQCLYAIYYVPGPSKGEPELPAEYEDFKDIFLENKANELMPHGQPDHAIELTNKPPYGPIYSLSEKELKVLHEYIQENLERGWIRESTSLAGASILFTSKKDSKL